MTLWAFSVFRFFVDGAILKRIKGFFFGGKRRLVDAKWIPKPSLGLGVASGTFGNPNGQFWRHFGDPQPAVAATKSQAAGCRRRPPAAAGRRYIRPPSSAGFLGV